MRKLICAMLALMILAGQANAAGRVALSFDDGPSGDNTEALLDMLADREVHASFFLCGYRIEAYPELCGALARAGHELGIHGYSHGCFDAMSPDELRDELTQTASLIREYAGVPPVLVRPPCGALNGGRRVFPSSSGRWTPKTGAAGTRTPSSEGSAARCTTAASSCCTTCTPALWTPRRGSSTGSGQRALNS